MKQYFLSLFLFLAGGLELLAQTPAADNPAVYLPFLKGKKVALVVNQTSMVGNKHLVDTLKNLQINIVKIFGPEHGFRGNAGNGDKVKSEIDKNTGIAVVSLYGSNRKPKPEQMADIDMVIFDIQDVGVRFYTYIGTMHYVMEACAEAGIPLLILDRPNPHGYYIDGPVLDMKYKSFVGMHPVPLVHGMTVGEYAQMINGEKWLANGKQCEIKVVKMTDYTHKSRYVLPVRPSPNLPNDLSVRLYPSLGLFEGTNMSMGRGTEFPFQVLGYPDKKFGTFSFTPQTIAGVATKPPHEGITCYGIDFRTKKIEDGLNISYLLDFYKISDTSKFFLANNFFNTLAGNATFQWQIKAGKSEKDIRKSWQSDLVAFKEKRKKYLLYTDFE